LDHRMHYLGGTTATDRHEWNQNLGATKQRRQKLLHIIYIVKTIYAIVQSE